MKKLTVLFCFLLVICGCREHTIEPIEQKVGKLNISIDPRMELLTVIQFLADYPHINKTGSYSESIKSFFKSDTSYEAVKLTGYLLEKYGFAYDAPVSLMLNLSAVPELKQKAELSDYLLYRTGGDKEILEEYGRAIKDFAERSDFERFWDSNKDIYSKCVELTVSELDGYDLVKDIEDYFNETQNSYNIIIAPLFRGGYGPRILAANGKYDIFSCNHATNEKDGIPYLSRLNLSYYVWHEFSHSFVNPLTSKYYDEVAKTEILFEPIREHMANMAYTDWHICVNEHIIRAVNLRLFEKHISTSESEYEKMLYRELSEKFIYIVPIIEKLKEYEKLRDTDNITFSDFYPSILNLFDSLSVVKYWETVKVPFMGTINDAMSSAKKAIIYPTSDKNINSLKTVQEYAKNVFDLFKSDGDILISDSQALEMQLADYAIMAYGTIESNLFLKHYKNSLPFKIENNVLYADKEYNGKSLKFISCLPSPQNIEKGMVVYTAFSNNDINGINNVFHGNEDYLVFTNPDSVITRGYYEKKGGIWKF